MPYVVCRTLGLDRDPVDGDRVFIGVNGHEFDIWRARQHACLSQEDAENLIKDVSCDKCRIMSDDDFEIELVAAMVRSGK